MDWSLAQVVLEPIILGGFIIEEDETNPTASSQFLSNFRRNQTQSVASPHEGALVLIRTNGLLNRRNFILPAIIPNINHTPLHRRAIPLPETSPSRVQSTPRDRLSSSATAGCSRRSTTVCGEKRRNPSSTSGQNQEEMKMTPFQNLWNCACPVPGSQPMIPCTECKRRECFEWTWDSGKSDNTAVFLNNDRDVMFNPGFSVGTAAVRGSIPLKQGYHHYWEIEMSSDVYGTDMMIGVGTKETDLVKYSHNFVSLLGLDDQSWGFSYMGSKHHNGKSQSYYSKNFGQHTVVGVHLDLWSGNMEFFINRKPLGKAFSGLQGKELYPMISSTAARSSMNLIFCRSYQPTLQLQTMLSLGKSMLLPDNVSLFKVLPDNVVPPGLKLWMKNNFWWITSSKEKKAVDKTDKKKKAETLGPSQGTRRARKIKKDPDEEYENPRMVTAEQFIANRTRASRRTVIPGANPIFAPEPICSDGPVPAKSARVSEISRPVTRSTSSPCVPDAISLDSDELERSRDLPPRASSSASSSSPEPGSKRMCLRSSKQDKK